MPKTIFIPSTYYDLIYYRKRVWETLSELNVKILGMEKFGARSTSPLQTCLEEVDNPIFLLALYPIDMDLSRKQPKSPILNLNTRGQSKTK